MNELTCSYNGKYMHSGTEHHIHCNRKPYKDGMCIIHLDKQTVAQEEEEDKHQIEVAFLDALDKEIEFAKTAPSQSVLYWNGAHFPAIKFENRTFPRKVLLSGATFEHGTNFNKCQFIGGLEAVKSKFLGIERNIKFKECRFIGEVNFWFANFGKNPVLEDCIFEEKVKFQGCHLDTPDFSGNQFLAGVEFAMTTFYGNCDFKLCQFRTEAYFLSMMVDESAYFDFRNSIVTGRLNFGAHNEQDDLLCAGLDFHSVEVVEKSTLDFQNMAVSSANFCQLLLSDGASLKFENIGLGKGELCDIVQRDKTVISFINTPLDNTTFLNTNIEKFNFINTKWTQIDGRQGLISEINLRDKILLLPRDKKLSPDEQRSLVEEIEFNSENYRQLVKNHEAKRNFSLAENFHVGEMEMQRQKGAIRGTKYMGLMRRLTSWNDFSVYKALSKYGTNYLHSLNVLGCMILLLAFLFLLSGLTRTESITRSHLKDGALKIQVSLLPSASNGLVKPAELIDDYVSSVLFTLSVATLQKDTLYKTTTAPGEFLRIVTFLFVPSQAAITLMAIRRRFRRGSGSE